VRIHRCQRELQPVQDTCTGQRVLSLSLRSRFPRRLSEDKDDEGNRKCRYKETDEADGRIGPSTTRRVQGGDGLQPDRKQGGQREFCHVLKDGEDQRGDRQLGGCRVPLLWTDDDPVDHGAVRHCQRFGGFDLADINNFIQQIRRSLSSSTTICETIISQITCLHSSHKPTCHLIAWPSG
ncbi:hypothetical protein PROFUN_17116, partial [Planoprotostelium fungivorum]